MDTTDALTALRGFDLPASRRQHLSALAVAAPTEPERVAVVLSAYQEARRNRQQAEADLKAELDARRAWAARNPDRPSERPTEPLKAAPRPVVHPVVVTYGPITKTAKARPERKPMMRPHKKYPAEEEKPKTASTRPC